MQGYIIRLNRARDEDLVVTILTQQNLETLYRFYGARHSTINLGFKIDFESEISLKSSIGRLRDVIEEEIPSWQRIYLLSGEVLLVLSWPTVSAANSAMN